MEHHTGDGHGDEKDRAAQANGTYRMYLKDYDILPHYVRPTVWNCWIAPRTWLGWLQGNPVPGDKEMCSGGFVMREVGPDAFRGKGGDDFERERVWLQEMLDGRGGERGRGCPMFVG